MTSEIPLVLVIDAHEDTCTMLMYILSQAGYIVTAVGDGDLGLAADSERPADLVIIEPYATTDKTELGYIELIKKFIERNRRIIITTSLVHFMLQLQTADFAANLGFLTKPVDPDELLHQVRQQLVNFPS